MDFLKLKKMKNPLLCLHIDYNGVSLLLMAAEVALIKKCVTGRESVIHLFLEGQALNIHSTFYLK